MDWQREEDGGGCCCCCCWWNEDMADRTGQRKEERYDNSQSSSTSGPAVTVTVNAVSHANPKRTTPSPNPPSPCPPIHHMFLLPPGARPRLPPITGTIRPLHPSSSPSFPRPLLLLLLLSSHGQFLTPTYLLLSSPSACPHRPLLYICSPGHNCTLLPATLPSDLLAH